MKNNCLNNVKTCHDRVNNFHIKDTAVLNICRKVLWSTTNTKITRFCRNVTVKFNTKSESSNSFTHNNEIKLQKLQSSHLQITSCILLLTVNQQMVQHLNQTSISIVNSDIYLITVHNKTTYKHFSFFFQQCFHNWVQLVVTSLAVDCLGCQNKVISKNIFTQLSLNSAQVNQSHSTKHDHNVQGQHYSAACRFSCCTMEFAVCHGICCLQQKNAELPVFATFISNSRFFGLLSNLICHNVLFILLCTAIT